MIVEIGHFGLALALALSLVQAVMPAWAMRSGDPALRGVATAAALGAFFCVALAFAALTYAHVTSDFSVLNVVEHSHTTKPLIYKVSGVWGNHEGSMLLWLLILVLFGGLVALSRRSVPAVSRPILPRCCQISRAARKQRPAAVYQGSGAPTA